MNNAAKQEIDEMEKSEDRSDLLQEKAEEVAEATAEEVDTNAAGQLMEIVEGMVFFHDEMGRPFVQIQRNGHNEIGDVKDKEFKNWLRHEYYCRHKGIVSSETLKQVVETLAGRAVYAGPEHRLYLRVAGNERLIWYDLANKDWQAVRIMAGGWQTFDNPPIIFRRYRKSAAQVMPDENGDVKKVLEFVNIKSKEEQCLFLTYLVYCFIPDLPKPLVHPHGEKGAAKSTMSRIIKKLVDPGNVDTVTMATNKGELVIQLAQSYMSLFDNLDTLSPWQSDVLCCAATGGGMTKRELFSNEGEMVFRFMRPVILNGINAVAQRSDLLDRCLLFELERIPARARMTEEQLWRSFEQARPAILGGIFNVLSKAMTIYPKVKIDSLPRMADFARWGCAIAQAIGYKQEYFMAAYEQNIGSATRAAIDSHPLATAILQLMANETSVEAGAVEMLARLENIADQYRIRANDRLFPRTAAVLVRRINEVRSNLQADGIEISITRDARNTSVIRIYREVQPEAQAETA